MADELEDEKPIADHRDLERNIAFAERYKARFEEYAPWGDHPISQFFHIQLLGKLLFFCVARLADGLPSQLESGNCKV